MPLRLSVYEHEAEIATAKAGEKLKDKNPDAPGMTRFGESDRE